jgi:type I restriction enzyme M protein
VYEDLVRRFNEENNEEAGEHFTPREIIDLMTHLVFLPVKDKIQQGTYLIYDPCAGSGGMLTIAKNFLINPEGLIKSKATVHLYGQESTPFIYATCKSDMLIKGEDPNKIAYGSTLSAYGFDTDLKFDFMLTNPPYGKTWAPDKKALGIGPKGSIIDKRFMLKGSYKGEAVTSRVNDGQLMFVLHMLSKMKDTELGSRIASVHNGSALFTGDAGQGESEIRKYLLEKDWLEAIIALPNDMFYNTGIPTYIFLIANKKSQQRKGKVQLINATTEFFYSKMRKSLGKKRVEYLPEHIQKIEELFINFEENEHSKIFDNDHFGYAQITVNRPLRDTEGNILTDSKGKPKPDPKLKDTENIPLKEDIQAFFEREVLPFAADAWWEKNDTKIGYEINFAKYFYKHQPPRALTEIAKDILAIEQETDGLLKEIIAT